MKVNFHATLRPLVGHRTIEVELRAGATVDDLLTVITRDRPTLREHLLSDEGSLLRHVNIFVDGRSTRFLEQGLATPIANARAIDLFPPVAGG